MQHPATCFSFLFTERGGSVNFSRKESTNSVGEVNFFRERQYARVLTLTLTIKNALSPDKQKIVEIKIHIYY